MLLSRIIRTGDLTKVIEWGISANDFTTTYTKSLFQSIMGYYTAAGTAGAVLGPNAMLAYYPHFVLCDDPGMTTDALCKEVRDNRLKAELRALVKDAGDYLEVDPGGVIQALHQRVTDLHNDCSPKKTDVHFVDGFRQAVMEAYNIAQGMDVSVCSWPWAPIQRKTLGIRPSDYIVLFGRPKSMKSWILCYLIAWAFDQSKRILIYTKEMPPVEIFERVGCCVAGVDYERFITGTLVPDEWRAVYDILEFLEIMRQQQVVVCLSAKDAPGGNDTVAWLESKVTKYQPQIVFIDGMYLMKDQYNAKKLHERVRHISMELRQMILRTNVPVIATVQANRDAAKNAEANSEEIAFSDSLGQDCTHLIRVIKEKGADTIALVMGNVARRFKLSGFRIWGIPGQNFTVKDEELSNKEADAAVRKDDSDTPEAKGKKGPPRQMTGQQAQAALGSFRAQ